MHSCCQPNESHKYLNTIDVEIVCFVLKPANCRHPDSWDRVVQCEYHNISTKNQERMRNVGEDYELL